MAEGGKGLFSGFGKAISCDASSAEEKAVMDEAAVRRQCQVELEAYHNSADFEERINRHYERLMEAEEERRGSGGGLGGGAVVEKAAEAAAAGSLTPEAQAKADAAVLLLLEEQGPRIATAAVADLVPLSLHQVTCYVCASNKNCMAKLFQLTLSCLYVGLELGVAGALLFGITRPSCTDNDSCPLGTWCTGDYRLLSQSKCAPCLGSYEKFCAVEDEDDAALQEAWDEQAGFYFGHPDRLERAQVCGNCVDGGTGSFVQWNHQQEKNIKVMNAMDWMVFVFVVFITVIAVVAETRDVLYCRLTLIAAEEESFWAIILGLLGLLRQFLVLPLLVWSVAQSLFVWGTNPLVMVTTTIAIVVVIGLNHVVYWVLTNDALRAEAKAFGTARLTETDKMMLAMSKWLYWAGIIAILVTKIVKFNYIKESDWGSDWIQKAADYPYGLELVYYPFIVGPMCESLWAVFVERRLWGLMGGFLRIVGAWFLLSYYVYSLYRYYYLPAL